MWSLLGIVSKLHSPICLATRSRLVDSSCVITLAIEFSSYDNAGMRPTKTQGGIASVGQSINWLRFYFGMTVVFCCRRRLRRKHKLNYELQWVFRLALRLTLRLNRSWNCRVIHFLVANFWH